MPKSEQVLSFPAFMAIGPLQGVTQKQLLSGYYVKAGAFVAIIGSLYESCALLGRMFKDDVNSLSQLLLVKSGNETAFMEFVKKQAVERLERYHQIYSSDPDSLFEFIFRIAPGFFMPLRSAHPYCFSGSSAFRIPVSR